MPINNTTVVPILYAARLYQTYEENRIYAARTNRSYESQLRGGPGDRIRISRLDTTAPNAIDTSYLPHENITYNALDATAVADFVLDKRYAWGLKLDDLRRIQSIPNLMDEGVRLTGLAIAKQVDTTVRSTFDNSTQGATSALATTLNHSATGGFKANDFNFAAFHRLLDVTGMPRAGRWIIMGPYSAECLQVYALQNDIIRSPNIPGSMRNGNIGNFAGFDIYVDNDDNSAYNSTADTATENWYIGNDSACMFASQMTQVEQLRLQNEFSDAVRGQLVYGVQMLDRTRMLKSVCSVSNIPD